MGACCSRDDRFEESTTEDLPEVDERNVSKKNENVDNNNNVKEDADDNEKQVKPEESSNFISMFSQQGRKGINQDAMTVWENFNGEKGSYFGAVIDGHGPSGHRVAQKVCRLLPSKLFSSSKYSERDSKDVEKDFFSFWKTNLLNTFEKVDDDLCSDGSFDTYCSGCTTVAVLKQENHLVIANLGDSRAIMCTRGQKNEIVPIQLTIDLKPNLPNEMERIKKCEGRVFAMGEEPEVFRLWMPHENCPGLAMARAFGDFCLKDFGLISTPDVFYQKLTESDEFVVLASDGIWDVLSNSEVIKIVSSTMKRSTAAKLLVSHATRAWRIKYPTSRADDCTAVCLFFKAQQQPLLTRSVSDTSHFSEKYSGHKRAKTYSHIWSTGLRRLVEEDELKQQ